MRLSILIILSFVGQIIFGQRNDNTWILGTRAAGIPNFMLNFSNDTLEWQPFDIASWAKSSRTTFPISNSNGELEFFVPGQKVFNSNFGLMENGDSINYGPNWNPGYGGYSDGGYIILPEPHKSNKYYTIYKNYQINTFPETRVIGTELKYSYIDMEQNDGKGKVVDKNIELLRLDTLDTDNMAACQHANGRDWWLPQIRYDDNWGYMYLLDSLGFKMTDTIRLDYLTRGGLGQSVFSPDGKKYISFNAVRQHLGHFLDIFDFDRCSGILSNHIQFNYLDTTVWSGGVAVSPNSQFLYLSNSERLYQFDLWTDDIISSIDTIAEFDGYADPFPARFYLMQLAPDGKIYMSSSNQVKVLHVIHNPNEKGKACNFEQHGIAFPHHIGFGLPKFPNYRLGSLDGSPCDTLGIDNTPVARFRWEKNDTLNPRQFSFVDLSYYEPSSWYWAINGMLISRDTNPTYTFDQSGTFEICLEVSNANGVDQMCKNLTIGVSTSENIQQTEFVNIYPNPAHEFLNVQIQNFKSQKDLSIRILDGLGREVSNSKVVIEDTTYSIPINGLPKGFYYLQIFEENALLHSAKFIKQ